ncbi:MAG: hypothetical protein ACT4P4_13185 [Betaproteobacteria bacterium]
MRAVLAAVLAACALGAAAPAFGQTGIRLPERSEPGIDPRFARGWLAPNFDRFGFAQYRWRDALGFAPSPRMHWSYSFSERGSLGMSMSSQRDFEPERAMSLHGRYWLSPDWALSAESMSREPGSVFRLQDLRIGVHRRF